MHAVSKDSVKRCTALSAGSRSLSVQLSLQVTFSINLCLLCHGRTPRSAAARAKHEACHSCSPASRHAEPPDFTDSAMSSPRPSHPQLSKSLPASLRCEPPEHLLAPQSQQPLPGLQEGRLDTLGLSNSGHGQVPLPFERLASPSEAGSDAGGLCTMPKGWPLSISAASTTSSEPGNSPRGRPELWSQVELAPAPLPPPGDSDRSLRNGERPSTAGEHAPSAGRLISEFLTRFTVTGKRDAPSAEKRDTDEVMIAARAHSAPAAALPAASLDRHPVRNFFDGIAAQFTPAPRPSVGAVESSGAAPRGEAEQTGAERLRSAAAPMEHDEPATVSFRPAHSMQPVLESLGEEPKHWRGILDELRDFLLPPPFRPATPQHNSEAPEQLSAAPRRSPERASLDSSFSPGRRESTPRSSAEAKSVDLTPLRRSSDAAQVVHPSGAEAAAEQPAATAQASSPDGSSAGSAYVSWPVSAFALVQAAGQAAASSQAGDSSVPNGARLSTDSIRSQLSQARTPHAVGSWAAPASPASATAASRSGSTRDWLLEASRSALVQLPAINTNGFSRARSDAAGSAASPAEAGHAWPSGSSHEGFVSSTSTPAAEERSEPAAEGAAGRESGIPWSPLPASSTFTSVSDDTGTSRASSPGTSRSTGWAGPPFLSGAAVHAPRDGRSGANPPSSPGPGPAGMELARIGIPKSPEGTPRTTANEMSSGAGPSGLPPPPSARGDSWLGERDSAAVAEQEAQDAARRSGRRKQKSWPQLAGRAGAGELGSGMGLVTPAWPVQSREYERLRKWRRMLGA